MTSPLELAKQLREAAAFLEQTEHKKFDYDSANALNRKQLYDAKQTIEKIQAPLLAAQADAARWRCLISMHYPNGPLIIADHSGTWGGLASWAGDDPCAAIDAQLSATKP
jgi:hypothetical protein